MLSFPALVFPNEKEINIEEFFFEFQKTKDEEIREKLIMYHISLVHGLAKKFVDRGIPLDSLISVGTIGLINAVDRYDTSKGVKFSTYATHLILGEIRRYFRDKTWGVKVSRKVRELNKLIQEAIEEMTIKLGRSPTISEIAKKMDVSNEEIIEALEAGNGYNPCSLDAVTKPENGKDYSLLNYLNSENQDIEQFYARLDLEEALHYLQKREQIIIRLYYFDDVSQTKIAQRLGISQMHVSRLLKQALANLKKIIKD